MKDGMDSMLTGLTATQHQALKDIAKSEKRSEAATHSTASSCFVVQ
jgi:hypothetical protein